MDINEVRNSRDGVVGFRCFQCGGIFQSMWENTCNGCRKKNENHQELIDEIKSLKEQLAKNLTDKKL